jgi:hypothetical protein
LYFLGAPNWFQLPLNVLPELRIFARGVHCGTSFDPPLILEVEVKGAHLLRCPSIWQLLLNSLFLDPRLKSVIELPAPQLQFEGSQILLQLALLVVEGKEQTLRIQFLKVFLASKQVLARKVPGFFPLLFDFRFFFLILAKKG